MRFKVDSAECVFSPILRFTKRAKGEGQRETPSDGGLPCRPPLPSCGLYCDLLGTSFFCDRRLQGQHAVLEFGFDLVGVDFLR